MLYLALALFTAAIVAVDQLTKYLAAAHLVGRTITLIPGWLQLHYITNDGMALSLLRGARWLFVVMTAVYLAVVVYVLVKKGFKKTPAPTGVEQGFGPRACERRARKTNYILLGAAVLAGLV